MGGWVVLFECNGWREGGGVYREPKLAFEEIPRQRKI